jgi:hypothetical protein
MATNDLMARALRFCVEHGYCEGLASDNEGPTMILSCSDCNARLELQVLDLPSCCTFSR